jgi:hypothetical protein
MGAVLWSALWGLLPTPRTLPQQHHVVNTFFHDFFILTTKMTANHCGSKKKFFQIIWKTVTQPLHQATKPHQKRPPSAALGRRGQTDFFRLVFLPTH